MVLYMFKAYMFTVGSIHALTIIWDAFTSPESSPLFRAFISLLLVVVCFGVAQVAWQDMLKPFIDFCRMIQMEIAQEQQLQARQQPQQQQAQQAQAPMQPQQQAVRNEGQDEEVLQV